MEPRIKFYGKIKNGTKHYYKPSLHNARIQELEGQEFEEILEPVHVDVSQDQHGYYRGGIIRSACMKHE